MSKWPESFVSPGYLKWANNLHPFGCLVIWNDGTGKKMLITCRCLLVFRLSIWNKLLHKMCHSVVWNKSFPSSKYVVSPSGRTNDCHSPVRCTVYPHTWRSAVSVEGYCAVGRSAVPILGWKRWPSGHKTWRSCGIGSRTLLLCMFTYQSPRPLVPSICRMGKSTWTAKLLTGAPENERVIISSPQQVFNFKFFKFWNVSTLSKNTFWRCAYYKTSRKAKKMI